MARSVPGLLSRRFGTPRAAAMVLVVLTGLAAFCIAAGPSALITLTRVEAGHEVGLLSESARNLDIGNSSIVPERGPARGASDPRLSTEIAQAWGTTYEDMAAIRDAWPENVRSIVGEGSAALLSVLDRADPQKIADDAPFALIRLLADPEWDQHIRIREGRLPDPTGSSRILPGDPDWNEDWAGFFEDPDTLLDPYDLFEFLWRIEPIEIVLVADVAERLQWRVGESRPWGNRGDISWIGRMGNTLTLVGTVELTDPNALIWNEVPYVSPAELYDDGNNRPRLTAAAFIAPESFWVANRPASERSQFYMWYPVDAEPVPGLDTAELLAGLRTIEADRPTVGGGQVRFYTGTTAALATSVARADSSAAVLGIALSGPVAVSIALIAVSAGLILRRRTSADRLLVSRGMTLGRLRRLLLAEGLLLGVPVAVAAVALARWVTPEDAGWIPDALGLAIGFAPALALLGAAADPLARIGRNTDLGAAKGGRRWLRVLWEVLVWGLAAAGAALMISRGASGGMHPLVILAPVLVAAAVGLLAVRLYPWPIRGILSDARRRRGPVGLVGSARTLRDPIVGGVAVLAIIVTVATVAFTATMLTTMQRGADGAAARAAGADVRITGPTFWPETLERIEQVPGVAGFATVASVNGVGVSGGEPMNLRLLVMDVNDVATVQEGLLGGMDAGIAPLASEPAVDILLGPGLDKRLGDASLTIGGVPLRVVGELDTVLGMTLAGDWAVVSPEGYQRVAESIASARTLLIRLDDEVRQAADEGDRAALDAVMADLVTALDEAHAMTDYWQQRARIGDSPAVASLRVSLLIALALSVLLAAIAFLLVAGVTRDDRARTIALLSTLGTDRRQQLGIIAWEFVPIALAGVVAGGVLGTLIPWLTVTGVNLRPFTGGRAQPALSVDPLMLGTMGAAALAVIGLVILVEVQMARRVPVVQILRSEDHG